MIENQRTFFGVIYAILLILVIILGAIVFNFIFSDTKTWIVYNNDVVIAQHCKDLWYDENYLYMENCGVVTLPHYPYKIEYVSDCHEVQVFTNYTRGLNCRMAILGRDVVTQWGYNDEN